MSPRRPAALLAALLLAALLAGCTAGGPDRGTSDGPRTDVASVESDLQPCPAQPDRAPAGSTSEGTALPPLSFPCFSGGTLDLARAPGVPTVVNLWASWCGPCREELPLMQQLAAAAGGRIAVVGVVSRDGVEQATSFAADAGATFPSAFDGQGELMTQLGLNALPFTYLLDADGAVVHTQIGPVRSYDELRQLVADHLGVQL